MNDKFQMTNVKSNVQEILRQLPKDVQLVAAAKGKSPQDIFEAVEAGVKIIGENYVQEAEKAFTLVGNKVKWHFIGHLQGNKVKKAVQLFDMIETVDSAEIAKQIDKQCAAIDKVMPILIEINSGEEQQKSGVLPEDAQALVKDISLFKNIKIQGLMTMGPFSGSPEEARPYFRETKIIFEKIKALELPNVEMRHLSMGMSNSYKVAVEEGANMVRIGTKIFGERT
ncbi:MAG: YggS family pyridoxal phosphate-dependent enzyme [Candidatus Omnitrophota bacterium]